MFADAVRSRSGPRGEDKGTVPLGDAERAAVAVRLAETRLAEAVRGDRAGGDLVGARRQGLAEREAPVGGAGRGLPALGSAGGALGELLGDDASGLAGEPAATLAERPDGDLDAAQADTGAVG